MAANQPSALGYALLGLINLAPQTGYSLREVLTDTPMKVYSGSPGAIYPALQKLERLELVTRAAQEGSSKQNFTLTGKGIRQLESWLRQPVTRADFETRQGAELLLRFVFMDGILARREIVTFLSEFETEARGYLDYVSDYLQSQRETLGELGVLALGHGTRSVTAHIEWAQEARKALSRKT